MNGQYNFIYYFTLLTLRYGIVTEYYIYTGITYIPPLDSVVFPFYSICKELF